MTLLRLLNAQGIAGLATALILALLLGAAKLDGRHWRKQGERFEALYRSETVAHARTVADVRTAADRARAADAAHAARVDADRAKITERTEYDFQARLAAARARAHGLRLDTQGSARAAGGGGGAAVPGIPAASGGAPQAAGEDRLPGPDALIATEQAIQLDELVKWVRAQGQVVQ